MAENKLIALAHKRYAQAVEADSEGARERLDDIKFVRLGQQWPESVKRDRERPGAERPSIACSNSEIK